MNTRTSNEPGMTWSDRKLCKMIKHQTEKKPQDQLEGWEITLLEAYSEGNGVFDWMSEEQLNPILEWAKNQEV